MRGAHHYGPPAAAPRAARALTHTAPGPPRRRDTHASQTRTHASTPTRRRTPCTLLYTRQDLSSFTPESPMLHNTGGCTTADPTSCARVRHHYSTPKLNLNTTGHFHQCATPLSPYCPLCPSPQHLQSEAEGHSHTTTPAQIDHLPTHNPPTPPPHTLRTYTSARESESRPSAMPRSLQAPLAATAVSRSS